MDDVIQKETDEYPFEIKNVDECTNTELLRDFKGEHTSYIQVGEKKWCFSSNARYFLKDFYNMEVRPTDVWIVSFPRSGTTLTLETVWLLMNDLDYEQSSKTQLELRTPFLEFHSLIHPKQIELFLEENAHSEENRNIIKNLLDGMFEHLKNMTERRIIKTHLPLSLLPQNLLTAGCKVVYVARNPKNVAISYYHHNRLFRTRGYIGDFPTYWNYFKRDLVIYAPYWEHILEAWNKRNEKNILFLFYENFAKDMKNTICQLQEFLGTNYSDDRITTLLNHLHIDNFKNNKTVNCSKLVEAGIFKKGEENFVRTGKREDEAYFSEQLLIEANEWLEENLKGTDLRFPNM